MVPCPVVPTLAALDLTTVAVPWGVTRRIGFATLVTVAPPIPHLQAKSSDRGSETNGRICEENRRCPRGGFPFSKPVQIAHMKLRQVVHLDIAW